MAHEKNLVFNFKNPTRKTCIPIRFLVIFLVIDIQEILKKDEGKTLEFKRDLSSPGPILKTLVAFSNTAGGVLLIGIEDKTKHIRGITDSLSAEERLVSLISDKIAPLMIPQVEIISWRKTELLAVRVYPSPNRPHFIKKKGPELGVYVRVGSTNRMADKSVLGELKRSIKHTGYDEEPLPELNREALDFKAASELFAEHRKLKKNDLSILGLMTHHQGRLVPTVAGIVLFGKEREKYFPDAKICCARFNGFDRQFIQDNLELQDYPPIAVRHVFDFVKKHANSEIIIKDIVHSEKSNIPMIAVREAVINAVVHTDYSQTGMTIKCSIFNDRLEIDSPGLLPLGLTIEDILTGMSKLRNRIIGRVFKELKMIEQWGSGIQRIIAECRNAGLKDPLFEEIGHIFRVTIFTNSLKPLEMDKIDTKIFNLIDKSEGLGTIEIAKKVSLSTRAVRTRLTRLMDRGIIIAIGKNARDPKRKYLTV